MDESRRNTLIAVALVLAVLQFLVVPWIASQSEARERLQVLTNRLVRSQAVLENKAAIQSAERAMIAEASKTRATPDMAMNQLAWEEFHRANGISLIKLSSK
jgi:uncharacterized membrane protein affecting hemolysin expression